MVLVHLCRPLIFMDPFTCMEPFCFRVVLLHLYMAFHCHFAWPSHPVSLPRSRVRGCASSVIIIIVIIIIIIIIDDIQWHVLDST